MSRNTVLNRLSTFATVLYKHSRYIALFLCELYKIERHLKQNPERCLRYLILNNFCFSRQMKYNPFNTSHTFHRQMENQCKLFIIKIWCVAHFTLNPFLKYPCSENIQKKSASSQCWVIQKTVSICYPPDKHYDESLQPLSSSFPTTPLPPPEQRIPSH